MEIEDNENDMDNNSIFENSSNKKLSKELLLNNEPQSSFITKIIETVSNVLAEKKDKKSFEKFKNEIEKNASFFTLLNSFGCKLTIEGEIIKIMCEEINLEGSIIINANDELEFDENSKKIFIYISDVVRKSNSLHDIITKYEEQGFYPIGELHKEKAVINKEECEVLVGTLENEKKEQKVIYYYNGQELFLEQQN